MEPRAHVIDPVCGMGVDPDDAIQVTHAGTAYYFCEAVCAEIFRDEPERWVEELEGDSVVHDH